MLKKILLIISLVSAISLAHASSLGDGPMVARLSFISGVGSFLPAGQMKWLNASRNRPLIAGDRLWSANKSLLELQFGTATLRMGYKTSIKILNLNQKITQIQLSGGTLIVRVWHLKPRQFVEINTPSFAFSITKPGLYRIFVDNKRQLTTVSTMKGQARVYGSRTTYEIMAGKSCVIAANLKISLCRALPPSDNFERWSNLRDRMGKGSTQYVSSDMIGDEDLDFYGSWRLDNSYGRIWIPNAVSPDWVPYRNGHWVWIPHWGWTWVDNQPWGFAPFHYGRWVYLGRKWAWVPGPRGVRPVYAPALVVFVDRKHFSGLTWFPLAPGEVYIPPRPVSREYFVSVNISNTYISNTYINKVYNNKNIVIPYQNVKVPNGITAVPTTTFIQSQPVEKSVTAVPTEIVVDAPKNTITNLIPEAPKPTETKETALSKPSTEMLNQPVVVVTKPEDSNAKDEVKIEFVKPQQTTTPIEVASMIQKAEDKKDLTDQKQAETQKQAEEQKQAEAQRQAETQQQAEAQRQAEAQQQAEAQRQAEAQQQAEAQRQVEVEQQAEAQRQAAEAQRQAEAQQQAEAQRQAEAQQQAEAQRQAEAQQQAEAQRQAEAQQQAEAQKQAEAQRQAAEAQQRQTEAQLHIQEPQRQVEMQQQPPASQ